MNTSLKIMQTGIGGLWPLNRPELKALSMIAWPHLTLPAHSHRGRAHEQFSPLPRPLPHEWASWPYHSDLDLRNKQSKERRSRHKMIKRRLTSIRQCKTCTDFQWKHPFQATDGRYRNKQGLSPCKAVAQYDFVLVWSSTLCLGVIQYALFRCDPVRFVSVWSSTLCFGVIQYALFWCDPVRFVWPSALCFGVSQYALFWCDPVRFVLVWSSTHLFWCDPVHLVRSSTLCFGVTQYALFWCDPVHLVWPSTLCFGVIQYTLFWCDPVHLVWPSTLCFQEFDDVCWEGKDHYKPRWHTTLLSLCREICLLGHHLHKTFNTTEHQQFNKTWS